MRHLPPTPVGIADPPAVWIYNIAIPVVAAALFVLFTVQCHRRRTLTWWWLFFVVGASCFWLETFGDWGQYLVYSPKLAHYSLPWRHTSPDNPYFMPAAYGLYWGVHAILVLRLAEWLGRRTGWRRGTGVLLFAAPVGYAWDLVVETTATHFGWWSYELPLGPYFDAGRGYQPLVVPIVIMFTWPNLVAWLAGDPTDAGRNHLERMFGLRRRPPRIDAVVVSAPAANRQLPAPPLAGTGGGTAIAALAITDVAAVGPAAGTPPAWDWRFELSRLGAWVVVFWTSFFVLLVVPLIVLRVTTGHPSVYIP